MLQILKGMGLQILEQPNIKKTKLGSYCYEEEREHMIIKLKKNKKLKKDILKNIGEEKSKEK